MSHFPHTCIKLIQSYSQLVLPGLKCVLNSEFYTLLFHTFSSIKFLKKTNRLTLPLHLKNNSVALVRERTIPTEWPPPIGEVSANFLQIEGCHVVSATDPNGRWSPFSGPEPLLFIQVAPQLTSRGWVDPVPDPLLLRKSGSAGNRTRDLCICSQKLWTLDHRGGRTWTFTFNFSTNFIWNIFYSKNKSERYYYKCI